MDQICIKDLEVFANHGVLEEENKLGQKFLVSINMNVDFSIASLTDGLDNTVNYAAVAAKANDFMKNHTFKLIESCARELAYHIILSYEEIKEITVEIKKPWAPVGLPLDTVSVKTTITWHDAYLALGSNMGGKEENIRTAIVNIDNDRLTKVVKKSELVETKPYGYEPQDNFINGAIKIKTLRTPYELLQLTKETENKLYRERTIHWGPRTIDVDIILYDDIVMDDEELTIPHSQMHLRDFVLVPLMQIGSGAVNKVFNKSVAQLLKECKTDTIIK